MRISVKLASLALAASLLLTGCGVSITGVTLGLPATMERGSTGQATPEYAYSGATPEQAQADELAGKLGLAYASSDPAVVMVDADGNLAAAVQGAALIRQAIQMLPHLLVWNMALCRLVWPRKHILGGILILQTALTGQS